MSSHHPDRYDEQMPRSRSSHHEAENRDCDREHDRERRRGDDRDHRRRAGDEAVEEERKKPSEHRRHDLERSRDHDEGRRDRDRDRERERGDRSRDDDDRRHKHRDRSESPDRHRHHQKSSQHSNRRRRHRSSDSAGDDSESDGSNSATESEDSDDRRRRRKDRKKEKKKDKETKEERKARKARKKEKKDKKHRKTAAVTSQWGTYGIISDSDHVNKQPEFRAWLVEERTINPETISKDKERKEFSRFVEDFNTATLPHEKYYDMAKYEIKMNMIRTGEPMNLVVDGGYDPNADLAAHSNNLRRPTTETQSFLSRAQLEELRKVQNERTEVAQRKVLGIDVPRNLGVRQEEQNKMWR